MLQPRTLFHKCVALCAILMIKILSNNFELMGINLQNNRLQGQVLDQPGNFYKYLGIKEYQL